MDSLPGDGGHSPALDVAVLDAARLNGALAPWPGLWREVRVVEETGSTNADLLAEAQAGAREGLVLVAEEQTAGRGRLGRAWHSPAGENLYCSVVLRPPRAPAEVPQVALVAGIAVAAAVEEAAGRRPAIKWPNDVLLDGKKVAGILTEMESEMERVHHVIAGIGVNLNTRRFPRELRTKASSLLLLTGRSIDRARFTAGLLAALEARYVRYLTVGFASVRTEWESYSCLTGTEVRVQGPGGEVTGRVLGLDDDGALRLRGPDGGITRIVAGEVTVRGGYGV